MMVINSNNKFSFKGLVRTCSSVFPGRLAAPSWSPHSQGDDDDCHSDDDNDVSKIENNVSVAGGPMRPGSPLPPGSASTHSTPSTSRRRSRIYIGDYHQNRDRDHHDHHDHCDHQPPLPQLPLTLLQLCTTSLTPCHPTSETKNLLNLEKSIYPKKRPKIPWNFLPASRPARVSATLLILLGTA